MSGTFQNWNQDAPGGLADTAAQVAAGTSSATADMEMSQGEAARFMNAYGAAVVAGHGVTEGPAGASGSSGLQ